MEYKTQDGKPTTLYRLVRQEPDWAANRIAHANKEYESLLADNTELVRRLKITQKWMETRLYQDGRCPWDAFVQEYPEAAGWSKGINE